MAPLKHLQNDSEQGKGRAWSSLLILKSSLSYMRNITLKFWSYAVLDTVGQDAPHLVNVVFCVFFQQFLMLRVTHHAEPSQEDSV